MNEAKAFRCVRCDREDVEPMGKPPFPNELGRRVAEEVCGECWEDWKRQQMLLINHYGLKLMDANAREFLLRNMKSFLLDEGPAGAEIDSSKEGQIDW